MNRVKRISKKALVLLCAVVVLISGTIIGIAEEPENSIAISSPSITVAKGSTIQLTAQVTAEEPGDYPVTWTSSDPDVATIDGSGLATGVEQGKTTITAEVPSLGISTTYVLNVVRKSNFLLNMFEKKQRLSYRYSYLDNYYYTDDRDCWQDAFGFYNIYDIIAPYVLIEYDYIRVYFTYKELDWMIQLWKGQYGLLFFGSEVGVYTKNHSDKDITAFTHFKCPEQENWLDMEMTLYRESRDDGELEYQFSREKDTYWWCTGFKPGQLRSVEPADELNMTTTIQMKDQEMCDMFVQGLLDCGFTQTQNVDLLKADQFFVDGLDVHIIWQNISEAYNSDTAIKTTVGVAATAGFIGFFLMLLLALFTVLGAGALGLFFIILI